jgi:hypothetical protein
MSVLVTICSKSPNARLYECITNLYKIQIGDSTNYKVCVVDSDSNDFRVYAKVKIYFPKVELHFIKNKNYEYGAWKYTLELYPDYDIYMCIQDSTVVHKKIPMDVNNNYIFFNHSGFHWHTSIIPAAVHAMNKSGLNYYHLIRTNFCLAQHSSFIVKNETIKDIFKTFTEPPINKDGSCCYERIFGLYFILKNITTMNLYAYMRKVHENRT